MQDTENTDKNADKLAAAESRYKAMLKQEDRLIAIGKDYKAHAEALAEALRRIAFDPIGVSDATHQEVLQGIENIARAALANWEAAQ